MKKLFVTVLTILSCGAAYALPVGNPSDASLLCDGLIWEGHCGDPCDPYLSWCDAFSTRIGFYGDYVFNRHLKLDDSDLDSDIDDTRINTNAAFIAANFWDRVDFFTTLGATNLSQEGNSKDFIPGTNGRFRLETSTDFSWSVGIRGSIWECGCTTLGAEAQYFRTKQHINRIVFDDLVTVNPARNIDMKYSEWQVGMGISHRINLLVPYVAVKWSGARMRNGDAAISIGDGVTAFLPNEKHGKRWGLAVGVSLVDCEKASFTAEGRFGDETAFHANVQIRI